MGRHAHEIVDLGVPRPGQRILVRLAAPKSYANTK